jgi:steroid delta-isomerase
MIESEYIVWDAPDGQNPARRASQLSYDAVGRKAKDEWLALFSDDAVVEDPVGVSYIDPEGKGHRGKEGLSEFWDTVIAPVTRFTFHVKDSFASGPNCANVSTFSTELADGSLADTELVAVYKLDDAGRIESMRAYWEVDRTIASLRKP